jgi:HKD family nuclease
MDIQFVDNQRIKLSEILASAFLESRTAKIAVAFAKYSGYRVIEQSLQKCLAENGDVEVLVGLDFHTTDAQTLRSFALLSQAFPNFKFYCYSDPSDGTAVYHPKLYLFETSTSLRSIIGSSNLTKGGLSENVEVNVLLDLEPDGEKAENIRDIYAQLKFQPSRFAPDSNYIEAYSEILERTKQPRIQRDETRQAIERLREVEQHLPKPYAIPGELQGWQRLVYSKLPDEEFQTSDLYRYASEFAQKYPENTRIEEKIRQILQQLRDKGIIIHLGSGRWKKS